jgi:hypothetical protein
VEDSREHGKEPSGSLIASQLAVSQEWFRSMKLVICSKIHEGRAIAQAVIRWLPTVPTRVQSRV